MNDSHDNNGRFKTKYPLVNDENWIKEQHYGFNLTPQEIADKQGCSLEYVYLKMHEFNIPNITLRHIYQRDEKGKKQCTTCKKWLDEKNFPICRRREDKLNSMCKQCRNKRWRELRENRKIIVFQYYTNGYMKCELCEIDDIDVLTIDHINGGGNKHRKEMIESSLITHLIKKNFPEGYRILCRNCNWKERLKQEKKI